MLLEAFVAVIALATVMIVGAGRRARAAGRDLRERHRRVPPRADSAIDPVVATTFGAMALSTFIFDTLDSATRLGRYILQELFGTRDRRLGLRRDRAHRRSCRSRSCSLAEQGQLSACSGRCSAPRTSCSRRCRCSRSRCGCKQLGKPIWFTVVPMVFVMAVTVVALVLQTRALVDAAVGTRAVDQRPGVAVLLGLAVVLVVYAVRAWRVPASRPDVEAVS